MKYIVFCMLLCVALVTLAAPVSATTYGSHYGVVDKWLGDYGNGQMDIIMQQLGAKWIRCGFDWDQIETSDNVYDWYLQDTMIDTMVAIGVNPYIDCSYTPAWARSGGTNATPPTNPAKYTEFISVQVNRYKDRVKYWGFWNEPNLSQFYNGTLTSYINNLLIPAISTVKAADASAKVVVGELSTAGDDVTALRTMLQAIDAAGKHNQVDVVCHHSYDGGNTASGRIADIDTLHNMLISIGWADKEFWITESGWQSSQGGEANQANQIIGMCNGMNARPWWSKFFYYTLTEGASGGFGLLRPDASHKPAYDQYQSYIAEHADDAEIVSDTIPTTMAAGQQYNVSVTVENTGTINWTNDVYKLGAVNDSDPFAATRHYLNPAEVIQPDQTKTFSFVMTAPTTAGNYTTDWQMVHEGVRWFGHSLVKVVNVTGGGQTPYAGVIAIPGTVQAENFDNGGQNVAYYDTSGGNSGGVYRSTDVDVAGTSDTGGGYCVGWTTTGEWLEYTVNVASSGDYSIKTRIATPYASGSFKMQMDGGDIFSTRSFASTGDWQAWTSIILPSAYLSAGQHILRYQFETGDYNLNQIEFISRGADAVSYDLGNPDIPDGMSHLSAGDGDTTPATVGGHYCKQNVNPNDDYYMYFDVADIYAYQGSRPNLYITVEYFDSGTAAIAMNYDAISDPWKTVWGPNRTNTNTWKSYTFHVTDAYFGNRENYGADFRIYGGGGTFYLDTVVVNS